MRKCLTVKGSLQDIQKGDCSLVCKYACFIFQENIRFVYLLESPRRGDSNKYTKRMICIKKNCSKVSVTDALDGSISSFFL